MHKLFKVLEFSLAALGVVGLTLKLSLLKGGDISLAFSLGMLSLLYFAGGYFQAPAKSARADSPQSFNGTALKIWSGILFSIGTIGMVGTLLFWQGFTIHVVMGLVGSTAMMLWAFFQAKTSTSVVAKSVFRRSAVIAGLCAAVFLVPKSMLFNAFHRDDPQLVEKWTLMNEHRNDLKYRADFEAYQRQQYTNSK